jgi:uncharacterized membrane-anchored protein
MIAFAATLLVVVFAGDFLHEEVGLPWRSIGVFVTSSVLLIVIAVLWLQTMRRWSRRPDGSDSRKNDKQRS